MSLLSKRYNEISPEPVRLVAVPAEQRILENGLAAASRESVEHGRELFGRDRTLRHGAETVALLIWEASDLKINGQPLTDQSERAVFGASSSDPVKSVE